MTYKYFKIFFGDLFGLANTSGKTGTLNLGNGTAAGTLSAATITGGNGTAVVNINQSASYTLGSNMTGSLALNHIGNGTTSLTGNNTYTGATTISAGTLQVGDGDTTGSLGSGSVIDNGTLSFNRSDSLIVSNNITGSGNLTQSGTGTLTLSAANTYTGATTVNSGTLTTSGADKISDSSAVIVNSGGMFSLGGTETIGSIAGAGNFNLNAYTLTAGGDNSTTSVSGAMTGTGGFVKTGTGTTSLTGNNSYAGVTTISAGTLQVGDGGTTGSLTSDISNNATLAFNRSDNSTYSGQISGTGAVTKSGNGSLTLTGANIYSGNTTVSAGTLNVNSSTSASSRFTVASGATLGGNGTIGGATMIYGIHSPGNSPGIQTFSGNLSYALSGASVPTVNWQLSGNTDTDFSAFDQIVVGGNLAFNTPTSLVLDFSGYGDVDWADSFWTADQSWVIYDVAGTTTGASNLTIATVNWLDYSGDSFDTILSESSFFLGLQGNDLVLTYTAGTSAVPEPSQVAASLLLLSGLGIYLWRRKNAASASRLRS